MSKAVGMLETRGIATAIEATDTMLKTADVVLFQQNKTDPALVTTYIEGDIDAIKTAIEAGRLLAQQKKALIAYSVIPAADRHTIEELIIEK